MGNDGERSSEVTGRSVRRRQEGGAGVRRIARAVYRAGRIAAPAGRPAAPGAMMVGACVRRPRS
jgi:hypothetical protein